MINKNFIILKQYNSKEQLSLIVNVDNIIYINDYDPYNGSYTVLCVNVFGKIKKYQVSDKFFDIIKKIRDLNSKVIYNFTYISNYHTSGRFLLCLSKIPLIKVNYIDKDRVRRYYYSIVLSSDGTLDTEFNSSLPLDELILNNNNQIPNNEYEEIYK